MTTVPQLKEQRRGPQPLERFDLVVINKRPDKKEMKKKKKKKNLFNPFLIIV